MVRISKTYVPKESEKYMCEKHKVFFKNKLLAWKKDLVRSNNEALYNSSMAVSYTHLRAHETS